MKQLLNGLGITSVFWGILKICSIVVALILISWGIAIFWNAHGDWWVNAQSDSTWKWMQRVFKPFLSNDITEAEEQIVFWFFWLSSFLLLTIGLAVIAFFWGLRGGQTR